MSGYLLDTNVLSELVRQRPEPRVVGALRAVAPDLLFTSAICVTELRYGAARHPHGEALWHRLSHEVLAKITVLPLGEREAWRAGELLAELERSGASIGIEDVLIGATALSHDLAVATRNVRHFSRLRGLHVEGWWPDDA